jgi:hypothetical protein
MISTPRLGTHGDVQRQSPAWGTSCVLSEMTDGPDRE